MSSDTRAFFLTKKEANLLSSALERWARYALREAACRRVGNLKETLAEVLSATKRAEEIENIVNHQWEVPL